MEIDVGLEKEQALKSLLNEARAEADALSRRVEKLEKIILSTRLLMGHEIKKPTTAITGFLELAVEELDEDEHRDIVAYVTKARNACQLLNELNLFFIELLEVDVRPGTVQSGEVSIRRFVDETLNHIPEHLNAKARVKTRISPDVQKFNLNPDAFKVILTNLLENALSYSTADKPVHIEIQRDREKRGVGGEHLLKLKVVDQGEGIPKSFIKKIFWPFVRLHDDDIEGTGLGLTLVRSLVELNGGQIHIRSKKGEGTTVYVTLPELTENPKLEHKS
ncbi:MAG: HAMP domain-containing sensor histidine kinase [Candidatus Krumholzibacteria bacterium]